MKTCGKCFEMKYSQLKYTTMLNFQQAGLMLCIFLFESSAIQQAFLFQKHLLLFYFHIIFSL